MSDGTFVYSLDPRTWMSAQLWHDGEIIFNGTSTGNSTEGKQVKVQWELHQNKYKNIKDDSLFIIDKEEPDVIIKYVFVWVVLLLFIKTLKSMFPFRLITIFLSSNTLFLFVGSLQTN